MINNFQRSNYFLMLATGAMLIGFAPIFVKWSELTPSAILFYRMTLTPVSYTHLTLPTILLV